RRAGARAPAAHGGRCARRGVLRQLPVRRAQRGVRMERRMRRRWTAAVALLVLAAACGPKALHHTVQPGETVAGIARHYGVPYEDIVRANRLRDPERIVVGRRLVIPGATGDAAPARATGSGHVMPIGFA